MSNLTKSLTQIKSQMRSTIQNASEKHGGMEPLSIALGKSKSYVAMVLHRDSFSGLQKLCELIEEIIPNE